MAELKKQVTLTCEAIITEEEAAAFLVAEGYTVTKDGEPPPPPPPLLEWEFWLWEKANGDPNGARNSMTLSEATELRYGLGDVWIYKTIPAGTYEISNSLFDGDPVSGSVKQVWRKSDGGGEPPPPPPDGETKTETYTEESGFVPSYGIGLGENIDFNNFNVATGRGKLEGFKGKGIRVFRTIINYGAYRTSDIPDEFIEKMISYGRLLADVGLSTIMHECYNFNNNNHLDTSMGQMMTHLQQLEPGYKGMGGTVAGRQGLWGKYGEQHSATHSGIGAGQDSNWQDRPGSDAKRRDIWEAQLATNAEHRGVGVRYPQQKKNLFSNTLTGFSDSLQGKLYHFNDNFFEDGWYSGDLRRYVNQDALYVKSHGEGYRSRSPYDQANTVQEGLKGTRMSSCQPHGVLSSMPQVTQLLGYRYVMDRAKLPVSIAANGSVSVEITMRNEGFASLHDPKNLVLEIRQGTRFFVTDAKSNGEGDARKVFPMPDETKTFTLIATFDSLPTGEVEILVGAQDLHEKLKDRADFSIRFANRNTWQDGYNRLGTTRVG